MAAISRRAFIGCLPSLAAAERAGSANELKRGRDPVTEFEIVRYTDPSHSSYLVPSHVRSVSQKSGFLLICCDRTGSMMAYRLEIKSGELQPIEGTEGVEPWGLALLGDDKTVCCLHGERLDLLTLGPGKPRSLYESGSSWKPFTMVLEDEGRSILVGERGAGRTVVRRFNPGKRTHETVLELDGEIGDLRPRPGGGSLLYRQEDRLFLYDYSKRAARRLNCDEETMPSVSWTANGRSVLYLCKPAGGRGIQLREHFPDSNEDKLVAPTSQFVAFARNRDGSVFAGVSGSKGSPYILLLLRSTRRELTIAEHRASTPAGITVFFTPDSQRIFYETDRMGKSAIFAIPAERLVEPTED